MEMQEECYANWDLRAVAGQLPRVHTGEQAQPRKDCREIQKLVERMIPHRKPLLLLSCEAMEVRGSLGSYCTPHSTLVGECLGMEWHGQCCCLIEMVTQYRLSKFHPFLLHCL